MGGGSFVTTALRVQYVICNRCVRDFVFGLIFAFCVLFSGLARRAR